MAIEELQNGRYRYLRLLGTGGMGEVYLMQDSRVQRQVAIKVLRAESSLYAGEKATNSARLFEREARAIAALDHPNILPLYDFGEEVSDQTVMTYMVMPYCSDGSLETWFSARNEGLLSPQQVAALIEQAAEALHYAHEHKVVHLDVKPSNFLIRSNRRDPLRPTLLLADFGIARNFTTISSSSRTIRGTPTTMAPEQWSGEPVFASDQYALAVMTYELLVGRPPFVGSLEQLMYRHFSVQAPAPSSFNPRLPAALDEVLQRALSKKPEERFPNIIDFANALIAAADEPPAYTDEELAGYDTLTVSQSEAEAGLSRMLTLSNGQELSVAVPAGVVDGQVLRLPREDAPDGQPKFMLVNIEVQGTDKSRVQEQTPSEEIIEETEQFLSKTPGPQTSPSQVSAQQERAATPLKAAQPQAQTPKVTPRLSQDQPLRLAAAEANAVAEPNLPTMVSLSDTGQITAAPISMPRPGQPRPRSGLLIISALLAVLIVLLLVGGSIYLYNSNHTQGAQANSQKSPPPTHVVAQTTPTATPSPTPTVAPGKYIADTYNGSMTDNNTSQQTNISVYLTQTHGSGVLGGSVTFNSSTIEPLHGTVDMQGNFTFTVQQAPGQQTLIFSGSLQSNNILHGNYCKAVNNACLANTGYFTAGPGF